MEECGPYPYLCTPFLVLYGIGWVLAKSRRASEPGVAKPCSIAFSIFVVMLLFGLLQASVTWVGLGRPHIQEGFKGVSELLRATRGYALPILSTAAWILIVIALARKMPMSDRRGEQLANFIADEDRPSS